MRENYFKGIYGASQWAYFTLSEAFSTTVRGTLFTDRSRRAKKVVKLPTDEFYCGPFQDRDNCFI